MISYHTNPLASLGGKQTGGMNVYVHQLSKSLGKLGHQVDIFTRANGKEKQNQITDISTNVKLISLPAGPESNLPKAELATFIPKFSEQILKWAVENQANYNFIHAHYWMSALASIPLKKKWNIPLVIMMHTLGLMKQRIDALPEEEANIRIRGERLALAEADKVVAATIAEQAELQWLYEVPIHKVDVVSPGVDLKLFHPASKKDSRKVLNLDPNEKVILFVGRIEALKGIETLIRALGVYEKIRSTKSEKFQLLIVGGKVIGDVSKQDFEMQRLMELAESLGLSKQVEFLGNREQGDLPIYYSAADLVVLPSHYESFGLVALEAMACARPVIASRVGGLTHLIQDGNNGFHVPKGDAGALAEKIKLLFSDERDLLKIGLQARTYAEGYSWDKTAREIEAIYKVEIQEK